MNPKIFRQLFTTGLRPYRLASQPTLIVAPKAEVKLMGKFESLRGEPEAKGVSADGLKLDSACLGKEMFADNVILK